jgi:membrane protease YdiL (CAAX protease family)
MPFVYSVGALFFWLTAMAIVVELSGVIASEEWQQIVLSNFGICAAGVFTAAVIIFFAKKHFCRGLRGFGIDLGTIWRDLGAAFLNLTAAWPLIVGAVLLTIQAAKMIYGAEYEIAQHQELDILSKYDQWSVRFSVFLLAVVVAPMVEELLFRGCLQTMFRSWTGLKWGSIFLTSGIFAMVHANLSHWFALFVLSSTMGYAYEKSGSLLRSIFIHAIFNGLSVLTVMYYPEISV